MTSGEGWGQLGELEGEIPAERRGKCPWSDRSDWSVAGGWLDRLETTDSIVNQSWLSTDTASNFYLESPGTFEAAAQFLSPNSCFVVQKRCKK